MQEPTIYAAAPLSIPHQASGIRTRLVATLIPVAIVVLIGGSLFWLQWASQRGIILGYPLPDVHIVAPEANTLRLNQNYQFSASASGRDITYEWGFGDQNMAYGANVNHSYASNGNFTVTVIVTDEAGHSSSATTDVSVFPPPPQATFTYSAYNYGSYVSFDASSSSADSSTSISAYQWDFGDGTTDTTSYSQDSHYYNSTGTFPVTLIVIDATGQRSDPYAMNVSVSLS